MQHLGEIKIVDMNLDGYPRCAEGRPGMGIMSEDSKALGVRVEPWNGRKPGYPDITGHSMSG
jgi:hypothetical protein